MADQRDQSWRRTGFTLPGGAAAAARKNHALGTAHRFTPQEARAAVAKRDEQRQQETRRDAVSTD